MNAASSPAVDTVPGTPVPSSKCERGSGTSSAAWLLAIVGWTALLAFYDLGGGARFEPIDCWVAQTAREMRAAGEWLVPRFSGETRMQKSPGPYWAVMLTSAIRGGPVDEVSARIPNALAAVMLVATIFWLARHIAGLRAAVYAGWAASASTLVLWWSHRGASDLGLATCTTVALAALWIAAECKPPGRQRNLLFLLGYFAAGVGMLYKMPMPLVVVGLPAVLYVVFGRRWRVLAHPIHLLGLLVFLLPWLPWAVAVTLAEDAALLKWKVEFLDRFTGDLPNVQGQRSWQFLFTYLAPTALYTVPFTLFLPQALANAFRRRPGVQPGGMLFLFLWYVGLLVFFTASAGKEERYFLPAIPPLFVLLGVELASLFDPDRTDRPRWIWLSAGAVWIGVPAGLIAAGFALRKWWELRGQDELTGLYTWPDVLRPYVVAAAIFATGFSLAALVYVRGRRPASFGLIVVTMWAAWLWVWPKFMPIMLAQRPYIDLATQLADPARVPSELRPTIRMAGSQDSRLIWYGDLRIPRLIDQLALLEEQRGRGGRTLAYEERRYGEEMLRRLRESEPILILAGLPDYLKFRVVAGEELAARGETFPGAYLWLQTRYGHEDKHFVLFGNRPPPYPQPALRLSDEVRRKLADKGVDPAHLDAVPLRTLPTPATLPARETVPPPNSAEPPAAGPAATRVPSPTSAPPTSAPTP